MKKLIGLQQEFHFLWNFETPPPQHQSSTNDDVSSADIEIASFESAFLDEPESPIVFKKPKTTQRKKPAVESDLEIDISNDSLAAGSKAKAKPTKPKVKKVAKSTKSVDKKVEKSVEKSTESFDIDERHIISGSRKRK